MESRLKRLRSRIEQWTPGLPLPVLKIFVVSAVVLLLFRKYGTARSYDRLIRPALDLDPDILLGNGSYGYLSLATVVLFCLLPLISARLLEGHRPADLGFVLGDWRKGLKWTGLFLAGMLPIVAAASFIPTFYQIYPLSKGAGQSAAAFALYEILMLLYFLAWEFFFRGYMLFSLEKHIGKVAILVQMIPFALLHGSKPLPEALASIFVGILLGYFALATRTFLYCGLIHFLVAFSMDVAALLQKSGL